MVNKWSVPTTSSAERMHLLIQAMNMATTSETEQMRERFLKDFPNYEKDRTAAQAQLDALHNAIFTCEGRVFRDVLKFFYPLWSEQMMHSGRTQVSDWVAAQQVFGPSWKAVEILDAFFYLISGQSPKEVERYIENIETLLSTGMGNFATQDRFIRTHADLAEMNAFRGNPRKYYPPHVLTGLEKGFSAWQLSRVSPNFYCFNNAFGTPEFLDELSGRYTFTQINSVLKVMSMSSFPALDAETLQDLLGTGFANLREIKAFIKNMGLRYSDPNVFRQIISIRKKATPEQALVLGQANPNTVQLGAVLNALS